MFREFGVRFDRLITYICEVVWLIMLFILYALNIGLLDGFSMFVVFWFRSCAEIIKLEFKISLLIY